MWLPIVSWIAPRPCPRIDPAVTASDTLLELRNLKKHFPVRAGLLSRVVGWVKALDGVDLMIRRGETLGLVGESGCGKSTLGRTLLRLEEPTEGEILFEGSDIGQLSNARMRVLRREMQVIFQDPYGSLNPRKTVGEIVAEPFVIQGASKDQALREQVLELLRLVGLRPEHYDRYPHQFSGGQRQRIGIARAVALKPKLIVCDEAVSALDMSIQAQVINLLQDLQEQFGLTYLFISHDLSVVEHICDRVSVMYLGRIVEVAATEELYQRPLHPYTRALLSASPVPDPTVVRERIILKGDVPSALHAPAGCPFHTRCEYAVAKCTQDLPPLEEIEPDHFARCWRARELAPARLQ